MGKSPMGRCPKSLFRLRAHKWVTQESQDFLTRECVRCGKKETVTKLTPEIYRETLPESVQKAFDDLTLALMKKAKLEKTIAERVVMEEFVLIARNFNTIRNYSNLSAKERQAFIDYWARTIIKFTFFRRLESQTDE